MSVQWKKVGRILNTVSVVSAALALIWMFLEPEGRHEYAIGSVHITRYAVTQTLLSVSLVTIMGRLALNLRSRGNGTRQGSRLS